MTESDTQYLIGVAVPANAGKGSKETTPVAGFMLHVPWLATTMLVVSVQESSTVLVAQILTLDAENGYDVPPTDPGVSSANGVKDCT